MTVSKELDAAFRFYESNASSWAKRHEGEWALISGEAVSFHPDYSTALSSGYQQYGLEPFFVKKVTAKPQAVQLFPFY